MNSKRFERLGEYLEELPTNISECVLTFERIESITGHDLIKRARESRHYWDRRYPRPDRRHDHGYAEAWYGRGWCSDADIGGKRVVFHRGLCPKAAQDPEAMR